MGFLRKNIVLLLPLAFILNGCIPSSIHVPVHMDENSYTMFGRTPGRDFYTPVHVSDSLKKIWEADLNGGLTNSSVTIYGDYLFVNDLSGWVACINRNTGKSSGQLKNKGAVYSSPVINDLTLIFPATLNNEDNTLIYFYNYLSGTMLAQPEIKGKVGTEFLKTGDGIVFNTDKGRVYKYNLTGQKQWETSTGVPTHSSPAEGNKIIVFGNDRGEIIGIGESGGKIIYRKKIGAHFYGSPAITGGRVFIGDDDGTLFCLNLSDGSVVWKYKTSGRIMAVPAMDDSSVYVANLAGDIYRLNKSDGKLLWIKELGGVINASPLLTANRLIVPDYDGKIFFLDSDNGRVKSEINLNAHAKLSPVIFENKLYIGYDNGIVAAYEFVE